MLFMKKKIFNLEFNQHGKQFKIEFWLIGTVFLSWKTKRF